MKGSVSIIIGLSWRGARVVKGGRLYICWLAPTLVRIQPPPPFQRAAAYCRLKSGDERGRSSMVEQKPSKLMTRVRFPSPAPVCGRGAVREAAHVAQWLSTPLVRERSAVQSCPWAPCFGIKSCSLRAAQSITIACLGVENGQKQV